MTATESALVVLQPGGATPPASTRDWEVPPAAVDAERVMEWFRGQGFETGPFVGTSFAITGPADLFLDVLGVAVRGDSGDLGYSTDQLDPSVSALVDAIVVQQPPDFGPGNP